MPSIDQSKILIISANGFEQSELMVPLEKLKSAVQLCTSRRPISRSRAGRTRTGATESRQCRSQDRRCRVSTSMTLSSFPAADEPGHSAHGEDAVSLVRKFADSGKVIAAICHGPWMLIEAGVIKGRQATSYNSIRTDMMNAGARWSDVEVANDEGIITSRSPKDLEAFVSKIIEEIGEGRHERRAA